MQITVEVAGDVEIARFVGRMDGDAAGVVRDPPLSRALPAVLDLSQVDYMDSAGLGAFVLLIRSYRDAGIGCMLAAPTPLVSKILHVTGIRQLAPVAPAVDAAVARLRAGTP